MDEIERAAREEIKRIQRDGYLGATSGRPRERSAPVKSIENGTYVPDEEDISLCLNCRKKDCRTGKCAKITEAKRRRAEANRNA